MRRWTIELLLLSVVIIWGINYTFGKYGVMELTSIDFTAIRMMVAGPLLLLITLGIERSIRIQANHLIRLFIVSIVGVTLYQTLFMETIKYISATNASLLISLSPIFTSLFSLLCKQEMFSNRKLMGSVIAFIGAALVLLVQDPMSGQKNMFLGNLIGMVTSMCWGLYPILANPLIRQYSALRVTAWSASIGAVPLVLLSGSNVYHLSFQLHLATWLSLLYSIFFVTIFGLVMWYVGVQKIGATNTMVYMYITPLTAVLFAAFWANEHIYLQHIIGGVVIFMGLWLVKKQARTPKPLR
ncbi:MAG TPA: DMT family transporter [Bacillota bacterium]|nr:DMT family transporter [Bacillota bacterium]